MSVGVSSTPEDPPCPTPPSCLLSSPCNCPLGYSHRACVAIINGSPDNHSAHHHAISPLELDDDSELGDEEIFISPETPALTFRNADLEFDSDANQLSAELAALPVSNALGLLPTDFDSSRHLFGVPPSNRFALPTPSRCASCAFSLNITSHRGCVCKSSQVGPLYTPPSSPLIRGIPGLDGSPEPLVLGLESSEDILNLEAALVSIGLVDPIATPPLPSEQAAPIFVECDTTAQGEIIGRLFFLDFHLFIL